MGKHHIKKTVIIVLMTGLNNISASVNADINESIERWQNSVLFNPSPAQLNREQSGSIMIYDGLSDTVVESVLDNQFDRINSMMFTRVIVTDERGDSLINPDTGDFVVEDDGCD